MAGFFRGAAPVSVFSAANAGQADWDHRQNSDSGDARQPRTKALRPVDEPDAHSENKQITYDPAKNMLRLHLHIGGKGDFEAPRRTPGVRFYWGKRQDLLSPLDNSSWHPAKSLQFLEEAVRSTEERYRHAISMSSLKGIISMEKTKAGIGGLSFAPNEVLGVSLDEASIERAKLLGFTVADSSLGGTHVVRLISPPEYDATRAQEVLSKDLPGHRFELNKVYRLYRAAVRDEAAAPESGAPAFARSCPPERCFARKIIQWQDNLSVCARGLRIGVIDTGADTRHPAFQGARIHEKNFAPASRPAAPDWHGTGVLALLAGNPASGTPGLVPDAEFFSASIFFTEDSGAMATDTLSLMKALSWMRANEVKIINMSFAGPEDGLVKDEVEKLSAQGIVLVAAAGNEGPAAEPAYPAAYPQVIAVTAITKDLLNYRYANRGNHIDVAAPGVDIWTAVPGGREGYHSGTSFAAPYVTGILALLPRDSLTGNKNDLLDSVPIVDLGVPGRDPVYGRGLLVAPSYCTPPPPSDTVASAAP